MRTTRVWDQRKIRREGVAAVEAAFVLPFLLLILFGVWELGRLVQLTQVVSNAAREGGRLSAAGTFSASTTSGTNPTWQIHQAIGNYLQNSGLPMPSGQIAVTITNTTKTVISKGLIAVSSATPPVISVTLSGTASLSDPVLNADQYDTIFVEVEYPFTFAKWMPLNPIFSLSENTKIYGSAKWPCMRDKAVTIDDTIPQSPLQ